MYALHLGGLVGSGLCSLGRLSGKFVSGKTRTDPTSDSRLRKASEQGSERARQKKADRALPGHNDARQHDAQNHGQGTVCSWCDPCHTNVDRGTAAQTAGCGCLSLRGGATRTPSTQGIQVRSYSLMQSDIASRTWSSSRRQGVDAFPSKKERQGHQAPMRAKFGAIPSRRAI